MQGKTALPRQTHGGQAGSNFGTGRIGGPATARSAAGFCMPYVRIGAHALIEALAMPTLRESLERTGGLRSGASALAQQRISALMAPRVLA